MQYVQQSLGPNEEIIHVGRFHWFYTFQAVLWGVIGLSGAIGILWAAIEFSYTGSVTMNQIIPAIQGLHVAFKMCAFGSFLLGIFIFMKMMITKATTEICVTDKRLIYKTGLIARNSWEMGVDRIESVNVFQGVLGRIFNFGLLTVMGMGVGEVPLPRIADPVAMRRAVDYARFHDDDDPKEKRRMEKEGLED